MDFQLIVIGLPLLLDGEIEHDQARLPQRLGGRFLGQRATKPPIAVLARIGIALQKPTLLPWLNIRYSVMMPLAIAAT